ncbi:OmpA family protein [Pendulispora brunnea]|uniref:OmpA family protein n=1 Tax=Pendulispora brunnea TaxID=2905690 RepID=A0ABZ2KD41_9BACT
MKPIVLAAGFAALGTVDLAFIDLRLVPAALAVAPSVAPRVAPQIAPPTAPPLASVPEKTTMAMASPSPVKETAEPIKEKAEPTPKAEPAPKAEAKVESTETRGGSAVTLHFDVNARTPAGDSAPDLKTIATMLVADPTLRVTIDGHSDRNGSAAYNEELSRQRAVAVAEELAELGVDRNRISSAAHGARIPVDKGKDAESLARNRRVEVHVERRKP